MSVGGKKMQISMIAHKEEKNEHEVEFIEHKTHQTCETRNVILSASPNCNCVRTSGAARKLSADCLWSFPLSITGERTKAKKRQRS